MTQKRRPPGETTRTGRRFGGRSARQQPSGLQRCTTSQRHPLPPSSSLHGLLLKHNPIPPLPIRVPGFTMHPRPIHHSELPQRPQHPTPPRARRRRPTHPHRRSTSKQIIMIHTQRSSASKSPLTMRLNNRILATLRLLSLERLRLSSQLRRTSVEPSRRRINLRDLTLTPLPVSHGRRIPSHPPQRTEQRELDRVPNKTHRHTLTASRMGTRHQDTRQALPDQRTTMHKPRRRSRPHRAHRRRRSRTRPQQRARSLLELPQRQDTSRSTPRTTPLEAQDRTPPRPQANPQARGHNPLPSPTRSAAGSLVAR